MPPSKSRPGGRLRTRGSAPPCPAGLSHLPGNAPSGSPVIRLVDAPALLRVQESGAGPAIIDQVDEQSPRRRLFLDFAAGGRYSLRPDGSPGLRAFPLALAGAMLLAVPRRRPGVPSARGHVPGSGVIDGLAGAAGRLGRPARDPRGGRFFARASRITPHSLMGGPPPACRRRTGQTIGTKRG